MALFYYHVLTAAGKKKKGTLEADNEKAARELLRQQRFILLKITVAEKNKRSIFSKKITRKVFSLKELTIVTRQLATLINAGLPLEEVLTAVAEQTEKHSAKNVLLSVRDHITQGHSFATALRYYPNAFSTLYCATVGAGEKSGHLDKVLLRLADYIEQQYQTRQKILHALIYPVIMIMVAFSIVGFLLEYVVPKMVAVYADTEQALPLLTNILLAISSGLKSAGIYILLSLMIVVGLFLYQLKTNLTFRKKIHRLLLRLPLLGNAINTIQTARFARTFAILFAAGVSVIEAMTVSATLITNLCIRTAVEEATHRVKEGATIHFALKQTRYFPPMSIHLIGSGESSGQLETMLERAANNQDTDIRRLIETSLALFEPMIILIMGAMVLFIVLAVLLPIFELNQIG